MSYFILVKWEVKVLLLVFVNKIFFHKQKEWDTLVGTFNEHYEDRHSIRSSRKEKNKNFKIQFTYIKKLNLKREPNNIPISDTLLPTKLIDGV